MKLIGTRSQEDKWMDDWGLQSKFLAFQNSAFCVPPSTEWEKEWWLKVIGGWKRSFQPWILRLQGISKRSIMCIFWSVLGFTIVSSGSMTGQKVRLCVYLYVGLMVVTDGVFILFDFMFFTCFYMTLTFTFCRIPITNY